MKVFIYTFGKVASSTIRNSISKYLDSDLEELAKIKIYPLILWKNEKSNN